MGKVRVKLVGQAEDEGKQEKKPKLEKKKTAKAPGLKGGERVISVGPSLEELEKEATKPVKQTETQPSFAKASKGKAKKTKKKVTSARYKKNLSLVKKNASCPLEKAIETLKQMKNTHFDETVELHVNVKEKGASGQLMLPHGTGKKTRAEVADASTSSGQAQLDALITKIEKGTIDFDILIATPQSMSKLAKVARILGPRGLMPNTKNGTITNKPNDVLEKLSKGQISFKTETQAPIIHVSVGKISFKEQQLKENIDALLSAIGVQKIKSATLKSTMSPGIHIDITSLN